MTPHFNAEIQRLIRAIDAEFAQNDRSGHYTIECHYKVGRRTRAKILGPVFEFIVGTTSG